MDARILLVLNRHTSKDTTIRLTGATKGAYREGAGSVSHSLALARWAARVAFADDHIRAQPSDRVSAWRVVHMGPPGEPGAELEGGIK